MKLLTVVKNIVATVVLTNITLTGCNNLINVMSAILPESKAPVVTEVTPPYRMVQGLKVYADPKLNDVQGLDRPALPGETGMEVIPEYETVNGRLVVVEPSETVESVNIETLGVPATATCEYYSKMTFYTLKEAPFRLDPRGGNSTVSAVVKEACGAKWKGEIDMTGLTQE